MDVHPGYYIYCPQSIFQKIWISIYQICYKAWKSGKELYHETVGGAELVRHNKKLDFFA